MKVRLLLWLGLVWFSLGNMAGADETKAASALAAVILDGETLFQVRGVKNIPAQSRADSIAQRVKRLAEDPYLSIDSITLVSDELSTDVMTGDKIIVAVLEPDATAEGVSRQERATRLADIIRTAIIKYREAHSIRNLLYGLLFAFIATALLAAFIYLLFRFFHKAERGLDSGIRRWLAPTRIRIFGFMIEGLLAGAVRLLRLLILAGSLFLYFSLILSFFPWTRTFAERLFSYTVYPFKKIGLDIWNELPNLILPSSVTIGYDAPWRQVHGLLLLAAERTGQVLRVPAPFVLQRALDDFYVNYELNVYVASSDDMPSLYSELYQNIQDAFNEYGVQIMSPHYVADPESAKIVPRV
jgi:hypothetical protein